MTLDSRPAFTDPAPASRAGTLLSLACLLIGLIAGLLASVGVLSGDTLGRVNLLYALLLFALLPALGLLVTLALLASGSRKGVMSMLLGLRLLPRQFRDYLNALPSSAQRSAQLFCASQLVTLAFALGSLLGFVLLLLATDISLVWRSTLLDAQAMLPLLDLVAAPWRFWPAAQPSLEMLKLTQDFRLAPTPSDAAYVGQWWRYLLASQLCYNLIPRTLLTLFARLRLKTSIVSASAQPSAPTAAPKPDFEPDVAPVVTVAPAGAILIDWAHLPAALGRELKQRLDATEFIAAGAARGSFANPADPHQFDAAIILVRSWEPPLGELADFVNALPAATPCFIAPLDWRDEGLLPPTLNHSLEWRRFCAELGSCQYLALAEQEQQ